MKASFKALALLREMPDRKCLILESFTYPLSSLKYWHSTLMHLVLKQSQHSPAYMHTKKANGLELLELGEYLIQTHYKSTFVALYRRRATAQYYSCLMEPFLSMRVYAYNDFLQRMQTHLKRDHLSCSIAKPWHHFLIHFTKCTFCMVKRWAGSLWIPVLLHSCYKSFIRLPKTQLHESHLALSSS